MSVTISGSAGITSPEVTLDNAAADGGQVVLKSSGYSNWNWDNYSGRLRAYYNATEYFTIDTSGNVGIGTSSPAVKQEVSVNAAAHTSVLRLSNQSTAGYGTNLDFYVGYASGYVCSQIFSAATGTNGGYLTFNTKADGGSLTERMRIDSSGNLLINTTSGSYKLTLNGQPGANGYTAWTNYSDSRLKENITDFVAEPILNKVCSLRPVTFNYNEASGYDEETRSRRISGFIAQELQQIFPEMVGEFVKDEETYLDTNLSNLTLYLLQAVKELSAKVDALEAK